MKRAASGRDIHDEFARVAWETARRGEVIVANIVYHIPQERKPSGKVPPRKRHSSCYASAKNAIG